MPSRDAPDSRAMDGHINPPKDLPRKRDLFPEPDAAASVTSADGRKDNNSLRPNGSAYTPTPALPLTPPAVSSDSDAEETPTRSLEHLSSARNPGSAGDATPAHQMSPPTPDITPPRVVSLLRKREGINHAQLSMSSRAESFTTAREALSSDDDAEKIAQANTSYLRPSKQRLPHPLRMNTSPSDPDLQQDVKRDDSTTFTPGRNKTVDRVDPHAFDTFDGQWNQSKEESPATSAQRRKQRRQRNITQNDKPVSNDIDGQNPEISPRPITREKSLQDRVRASQSNPISASTEKFGQEIGWVSPVEDERTWRNSGLSTTSIIEAMVIDSPPQRRRTLRHVGKISSLRSVSLPTAALRDRALDSNNLGEQHHRLLHKPARISDQNRWSVNSDMSFPTSIVSTPSKQKQEVIPVVVIPQRRSSLRSSAPSSRTHSQTRSSGSHRRPMTAPNGGVPPFDIPRQKRRTLSESVPSSARHSRDVNRRGRSFGPPVIPPRSSSMSAPTSRNHSRAPSIASDTARRYSMDQCAQPTKSQATRGQREYLGAPGRKGPLPELAIHPAEPRPQTPNHTFHENVVPVSPSLRLTTPFQASIQSLSPGPVEIHEARAVPFFSHNNKSLLVIEQYPQLESRISQGIRTSRDQGSGNLADPQTPVMSKDRLVADVDSPLRNPRPPPRPPAFKVIPPTPHDERRNPLGRSNSSGTDNGVVSRFSSVRRALSARRRSETYSTPVQTHRVKNRKAGQQIDSKLHPFWRPRGFWEDFPDSEDENRAAARGVDGSYEEDGVVANSLGFPQMNVIFQGPLSIIRRVSNRSRRRRAPVQTASTYARKNTGRQSPLLRAARHPRRVIFPGLNGRLTFLRLDDLQDWLARNRLKRQQDKLEARRERLRQSIGGRVAVNF